ncbi:hypothetical protein GE278_20350 [Enterobacteriaceae bacterium Kacie_13]|nr:hypothetical protein GE278_20350 [Enterobacteriaceae bacterium Kacie_13]
MLHIFSDDYYFGQGVAALLSEKGFRAQAICSAKWQDFCDTELLGRSDVIIVTFSYSAMMDKILNLALHAQVPVIFVMNILRSAQPELLWNQGIVSKNIDCASLIRALVTALLQPYSGSFSTLTRRERDVLGELLKEKNGAAISAAMRLSVKAVSRYKHLALKKLGLYELNSRAIVIYGKILQMQLHKDQASSLRKKNNLFLL